MKKRIVITIITGALLGVFCIVGVTLRTSGDIASAYLFSFWFNRVLMGLMFGLLPVNINLSKRLFRGFILGIFVSFAFYSATEFNDLTGFLAGGLYGIIIEFVAFKFELKNK